MKKKILIFGAGAIGRGYLPWLIDNNRVELNYVETNQKIIQSLKKGFFYTFKIKKQKYISKKVFINKTYNFKDIKKFINDFDLIVLCAGPRNVKNIASYLLNYKNNILILENDINIKTYLKNILKTKKIFFGIPDVISSNTSSKVIRKKYGNDTLFTEDGECFIEKGLEQYFKYAKFVNNKELLKQWLCKLYLHNTVHCIMAYIGHLKKFNFIHEISNTSYAINFLRKCFFEIQKFLVKYYKIPLKDLKKYSAKEISRFRNKLLFDPIERVAREPFRKLAIDERLVGAANKCLSSGVYPYHLCMGIFFAFYYFNRKDQDFNIYYLRSSLDKENFLEIVIGLRQGEPLYDFMIKNWQEYKKELKKIKKN